MLTTHTRSHSWALLKNKTLETEGHIAKNETNALTTLVTITNKSPESWLRTRLMHMLPFLRNSFLAPRKLPFLSSQNL